MHNRLKLIVVALLLGLGCRSEMLSANGQPEFWMVAADKTIPSRSPDGQKHWSSVIWIRMLSAAETSTHVSLYEQIGFKVWTDNNKFIEPNCWRNAARMPDSRDIIELRRGITEQVGYIIYLKGHTLTIETGAWGQCDFELKRVGKIKIEFTYSSSADNQEPMIRELERRTVDDPIRDIYRGPKNCVLSLQIKEFPQEPGGK